MGVMTTREVPGTASACPSAVRVMGGPAMSGFVITQPHGLACEVINQTYSDATGVPMWRTVFADGYVGRYMAASADTLDYLLTLPRYAPGTRAGVALEFARDAAREA